MDDPLYKYRPRYYRRDGTPYPDDERLVPNPAGELLGGVLAWANDFEKSDRTVARDTIQLNEWVVWGRTIKWMAKSLYRAFVKGKKMKPRPADHVLVSTVWLGLDHGWGDGPPLIFETMVFAGRGEDTGQWRYATEVGALESHRWICHLIRSGYLQVPYDYDGD